jgi:flagellar protein FliS
MPMEIREIERKENFMEGYKSYKEVDIETASGLKLVVMLYQGAIRFLGIAKDAIRDRKLDVAHNNLLKAQDIVLELISSLNFDAGEIAHNLYSLYMYMNRRLIEANVAKDVTIIDEVIKLMTTLKEAWETLLSQQRDETPNDQKNLNLLG